MDRFERIRARMEAWNDDDQATWLAGYSEDVEIRPAISDGIPVVGMDGLRGHEGARAWWDEVKGMHAEFKLRPEEFRDLGAAVLVIGCTESVTDTGMRLRLPHAWLFWWRGDLVCRLDTYVDPAEALAAAPAG